ncbi:SRPBCC family protein [Couchioplanes caeruleus]|uniref:SRPBCC family protein n=1 Tax=Couchioplanes caeruleus TaxID=56438 RepID=UPI0020C08A30|nr:SRPBCC family protein [Couchioplanes caeruleus]UQU67583.1 SRPBCC family protein [Couchioplanes caeruleus]
MLAFLKITRTTTRASRVRETGSVELPQAAATMWSFLSDPASSTKLNQAELGVTLPGSPQGLGEIQVAVFGTGNGRHARVHEVVELEPGRRAVTRSLTTTFPAYSVLSIEPTGPESCRLTQEFWVDVPAGIALDTVRAVKHNCHQELRTMMNLLSEVAPGLEP